MALNNNQVADVVKAAFKQSTGSEAIDTLDLEGIIDAGKSGEFTPEKEPFTKALISVLTKNWFTDSSYRSSYNDPFFEDAERFGAIVQAISIEVPEVTESHAWKDFSPTVDPSTGEVTYATAGIYNVYVPMVDTCYYTKSISYELPIAITNEQWDVAFDNASEISSFVTYVLMVVNNAIVIHLENMNNANRNNFIAEKVDYSARQGATGVHVINLVEEYQKSQVTPSDMTVEEYLTEVGALLNGPEVMMNHIDMLKKPTRIYNTAQKLRFTPEDRLIVQVLSQYENRLNVVGRSNVYHDELTKLPGHEKIPYWQAPGTKNEFSDVSNINIKTANGETIDVHGVVAFVADKWAVLHTIRSRRVAATYFDPENITQYYNQFRDQYMNDLTMNAIVFVLQDYTVSGVEAGVKVTVLEQSDSVYGTAVSDIQDANMELIGNNFKGTSKWLASGTVASDWGAGNFIAIDFEDLPEEADKIMVGLEPSMGSGMVELTPDDTKSVFKIADKDLQELVIKTSIGSRTITQKVSLKGVTLASS